MKNKFPEAPTEEGRMVYISSAWLKTCDLYQRFLNFYNQMATGDKNYFVASLDYRVGIDAGLFTEESMMLEKNDRDKKKNNKMMDDLLVVLMIVIILMI